MSEPGLPLTIETISPDWMSQALSTGGRDVAVTGLAVESVIWGTATKVFLDVAYADGHADLPPRLCLKGGFDPAMRQIMAAGYQVEAQFYRDIGPQLAAGLPTCYFADVDPDAGQGVVLMNDLRTQDAAFLGAGETLSADQVAAGLSVLAALHATDERTMPWLRPPDNLRAVAGAVLTEENWSARMATAQPETVQKALGDRDRFLRALHRLWELEDAVPGCLTHGDANITNVFVSGDGRPRFVDWQFVARSDWAHDVALFLVSGLATGDRREHERDLLTRYLEERGLHPDETWDDAWVRYRRHALYGLLYAVTPDAMQPAAVRNPISERFAAAVADHATYDLLGA